MSRRTSKLVVASLILTLVAADANDDREEKPEAGSPQAYTYTKTEKFHYRHETIFFCCVDLTQFTNAAGGYKFPSGFSTNNITAKFYKTENSSKNPDKIWTVVNAYPSATGTSLFLVLVALQPSQSEEEKSKKHDQSSGSGNLVITTTDPSTGCGVNTYTIIPTDTAPTS